MPLGHNFVIGNISATSITSRPARRFNKRVNYACCKSLHDLTSIADREASEEKFFPLTNGRRIFHLLSEDLHCIVFQSHWIDYAGYYYDETRAEIIQ